jgi:FkbH-like protein
MTTTEVTVAEILAEVDQRPTLARIVAANRRLAEMADSAEAVMRRKKLVFVRNFTLEPIEPYLRLAGFRAGIQLDIRWSGYDPTAQDLADIALSGADATVVFLRIEELAPALTTDAGTIGSARASALQAESVDRVLTLVREAMRGGGPVLVHNFITPVWPAAGLLDAQNPLGQTNLIRRMNVDLAAAVADLDGVYLVDTDHLVARLGLENCYDPRSGRMSDAPFSPGALRSIAEAELRHFRALGGPRVKCLVLDCDNTLWGGVVGESGISGIVLGDTGPGRVYRDLQQRLLDLKRRGILLALTSKNEEADVLAVLRDHPDCLLGEGDFAALRVNWEEKAANIRSIAVELNLSLEHVAFLDDDEFECGSVAAQLPEVIVLRWPVDVAGPQSVDASELFDTLMVTDEDAARTDLYRAETARRGLEATASSPEAYLRSLGLRATIGRAGKAQYGRLAQLTQRTNQFNLTTRRYDLADIERIAARSNVAVLWLQLEDRFGSYGIVGCAILVVEGGEGTIDTFLMSCRVLGRRADGILLNRLAREARRLGASVLVGEYRPSARNQQVADLYRTAGFSGPEADDDGVTRWRWPLEQGDPPSPPWIDVVDQEHHETGMVAQ